MEIPLQITFNNLPWSKAVEASIRSLAAKLDRYQQDIMNCRVVVEAPHKNHHLDNHYLVKISVKVLGAVLNSGYEPRAHDRDKDLNAVIRDAFDAIGRQLEHHAGMEVHRAKAHRTRARTPHGRIVEIYPDTGHGRIATDDGRQVYFHRDSVVGIDFTKLEIGAEVRFAEEISAEGARAGAVHLIDRRTVAA